MMGHKNSILSIPAMALLFANLASKTNAQFFDGQSTRASFLVQSEDLNGWTDSA